MLQTRYDRSPVDLVHPEDGVLNGQLLRSPFLDTPSPDPLLLVEPPLRAAFVLSSWGEDPTEIGRRILRAETDPHLATFAAIDEVCRQTNIEPVTRCSDELRGMLPNVVIRWVFIAQASGAFPARGQNHGTYAAREIAEGLRIGRHTVMRHAKAARAILEQFREQRRAAC
jgi:hypothetical protein